MLVAQVPIDPTSYDHTTGQMKGPQLVFRNLPNDPGEVLGWLVNTSQSVPSWMSSEFSNAHDEHVKGVPGANLNLYAHDWFEKITFVPVDNVKTSADKTQFDDWSNQNILFMNSFDHALSTGCQLAVPRTRVQKLTFDSTAKFKTSIEPYKSNRSLPADVFYAVVSELSGSNPLAAEEITIAPLANRLAFTQWRKHKEALAISHRLRYEKISTTDITKRREAAHNAAKAFQGSP